MVNVISDLSGVTCLALELHGAVHVTNVRTSVHTHTNVVLVRSLHFSYGLVTAMQSPSP